MKQAIALLLTFSALVALPVRAVHASTPPAPASAGMVVSGDVLETKDVDSYTYVRLKTAQGETWAAIPTATLKKGQTIRIDNAMVMNNFESKSLKRTFPSIVFGSLAGAAGAAAPAYAPKPVDTTPIKVSKAPGASGHTVGELFAKPQAFQDKTVQVHGKVVKFNPGIMGRNWVHLRDGTGKEADGSNDLLATTKDMVKVGDVVTASGVVHLNKDFGAGYSYPVLIEDASVRP